jgi:AcrR family transcriptional regulator
MGRRSNTVERRGQILKTAAALFIRHGYINTSIRDIATRCGINVATIYHHIGSKSNILTLFQEYTMEHLQKKHREVLKAIDHLAPAKALTFTVRKYLEWVEDYQDITIFWYQEAKNLTQEQLRNLVEQEEYTVEVFKELLEKGVRAGEFHVSEPRMAAHNIVVLCDMWAFRRWLLKKHYTFDDFVEHQTKLILAQVNAGQS